MADKPKLSDGFLAELARNNPLGLQLEPEDVASWFEIVWPVYRRKRYRDHGRAIRSWWSRVNQRDVNNARIRRIRLEEHPEGKPMPAPAPEELPVPQRREITLWARGECPEVSGLRTLRASWERFRTHHRDLGTLAFDWPARFRDWIRVDCERRRAQTQLLRDEQPQDRGERESVVVSIGDYLARGKGGA